MSVVTADSRNIHVLMVEDDPADARLALYALRSGDGYHLHHVSNLQQAIDWAKTEPCDVVLLDLGLPDSEGFATLAAMKGSAPELPIIVLTGHDDHDFAIAALEAGAQDYLIKGDFTGGTLQRAVRYGMARKSMEDRIRKAESQLRVIFSVAPEAILVLDRSGRVTLANPAAESLFGRRVAALCGLDIAELLNGAAEHLAEFDNSAADLHLEGKGLCGGKEFSAAYSIAPMDTDKGRSFLVVIRDVTETKRAESELRRQALTDPLTGLVNRRRFEEACNAEWLRFKRYGANSALLMLDIDHFKAINDRFGHPAGDQVLIALAEVCRHTLRSTDVPSRFGGEEFALLLPLTALSGAHEIAVRLCEKLAATRVDSAAGPIDFTVSIGVAAFSTADDDMDALISRADAALYRAKNEGRNRVVCAE
jgi:diguanylate cyclase (GGDEF)-like protein/PAS domain S-box-containing protein